MDYSVDTMGFLEAGLFGACKGLIKFYEQKKEEVQKRQQQETDDLENQQQLDRTDLQKKQEREQQWQPAPRRRQRQPQPLQVTHDQEELWMKQGHDQDRKKQQKRHREEQDQLLEEPLLKREKATWIAHCLDQFLKSSAQMSIPAAMAGAKELAEYIATVSMVDSAEAQQKVSQKAMASAEAIAQLQEAVPAQPRPPSVMFTKDEISRMHNMLAPNLLVGFQKLMFREGQCFRLGKDKRIPKLE